MRIDGLDFFFLVWKQCRQAKISYTGKLMADVEFQYLDAGSPVVRERFNFGQFPVMLKVIISYVLPHYNVKKIMIFLLYMNILGL